MSEATPEKRPTPEVAISDFPLLQKLFSDDAGVESQEEIERTYTPGRALTERELMALSEGEFLEMEQAYVRTRNGEGKTKRIRLRWTLGPEQSEPILRLAFKEKKQKAKQGRTERQINFLKTYGSPETKEFERLWGQNMYSHTLRKRRYYIKHAFPLEPGGEKKETCSIHYDVLKGPPQELDGYARIEIEFDSEAGAAAATANKALLGIDWIGQDVTDDKRYRMKSIAKTGKRPENQPLAKEKQEAEED